MDQGSNRKHSAVHNFAPTVTKFCVMWEGQALPHDTKFSNCRCEIVGRRVIFIWSLIPGSSWSGLIKAEPRTLSFGPLGTSFSEILVDIYIVSFKKKTFENVVWEMAAILSRPQCVMIADVAVISHLIYHKIILNYNISLSPHVHVLCWCEFMLRNKMLEFVRWKGKCEKYVAIICLTTIMRHFFPWHLNAIVDVVAEFAIEMN